jgi:methionine-rich copper-binding protein CopC
MKTKIFTILVILSAFFALSCETPDENKVENIEVTFLSLTANGSENLTTSKLPLTFDKDIEGADISIHLEAGLTGAVKSSFNKIDTGIYELSIKDVTRGGIVKVALSSYKSIYTFNGFPKEVTIYYKQGSSDGDGDGDGDDNDIPSELVTKWFTHQTLADDGTGIATLEFTSSGKLLYMGVDNQLTISVNGSVISIYRSKEKVGTVNYAISGTALNFSDVTGETVLSPDITFYKKGETPVPPVIKDIDVNFNSISADGSAGTHYNNPVLTTKLTLNFSKNIEDFNAADITINAGTTGATKGTLTKIQDQGRYELTLTGIIAGGSITVSVSKDGYNVTGNSTNLTAGSRQVMIYFYETTSSELTFGDFKYVYGTITSKVTITGYTGIGGNVSIPSSIDGKTVTAIANGTWDDYRYIDGVFGNKNLTSVSIPNTITHIGGAAFRNNKLTSISIPTSVISIENIAFSHNNLTSVTIPDNVTYLGGYAFSNNENLSSVVISKNVTNILQQTFNYTSITSITIGANVTFNQYPKSVFTFADTVENQFEPERAISGFIDFYDDNGKEAGTYIYQGEIPDGEWIKQ